MGKKGQRLKAKRRRQREARLANEKHPGLSKHHGITWGLNYTKLPDAFNGPYTMEVTKDAR